MTAQDAAYGKPKTLERSVLDDGLTGVFTARRRETARRTEKWRDGQLIEADGQYQQTS